MSFDLRSSLIILLLLSIIGVGFSNSINIISPPDLAQTIVTKPSFTFTAISYANLSFNCTLYIDNQPYGTKSIQNNTQSTIIANNTLPSVDHSWSINCTDSKGSFNSSQRIIGIGQNFHRCAVLMDGGRIFYLDNNITNAKNLKCIQFNSNNISLNCENHKVFGVNSGNFVGNYVASIIGIYSDKNNTKIYNCNVQRWIYGIELENLSNAEVYNNTIESNYYKPPALGALPNGQNFKVLDCNNVSFYNNIGNNSVSNNHGSNVGNVYVNDTQSLNITNNHLYIGNLEILNSNDSYLKFNTFIIAPIVLSNSKFNNLIGNTLTLSNSRFNSLSNLIYYYNYPGIQITNSSNNIIKSNNISYCLNGISIYNSSDDLIASNYINHSYYVTDLLPRIESGAGISLNLTTNENLNSDIINNSNQGIVVINSTGIIKNVTVTRSYHDGVQIKDSSSIKLINNSINFNDGYGVIERSSNNISYLNNSISYNSMTSFITQDVKEIKSGVSNTISFNFVYPNSTADNISSFRILHSTIGVISSSTNTSSTSIQVSSNYVGNGGLLINEIDNDGNNITHYMNFLINNDQYSNLIHKSIKYYFRPDIEPVHSQPAGSDSKALLFEPPTSTSSFKCGYWIQASPDEYPFYYQGTLVNTSIDIWYTISNSGYLGLQRYVGYGTDIGVNASVPASTNIKFINRTLTNINWSMNSPDDWYSLSYKLDSSIIGSGNPHMYTSPDNISYVIINYTISSPIPLGGTPNPQKGLIFLGSLLNNKLNKADVILDGKGIHTIEFKMPLNGNYVVLFDGKLCDKSNMNCNFTDSGVGVGQDFNISVKLGSEHSINIEPYIAPKTSAPTINYDLVQNTSDRKEIMFVGNVESEAIYNLKPIDFIGASINSLKIQTNQNEMNTYLYIIKKSSIFNCVIPIKDYKVYEYLSFYTNIPDSDIIYADLGINISKSWINDNHISDVLFVRCNPYKVFETEKVNETNNTIILHSRIPGFSDWAIVGTENVSCPLPTNWSNCVNGEQTRTIYSLFNNTCKQITETRLCNICPICPQPTNWTLISEKINLFTGKDTLSYERTYYRCNNETNYTCKLFNETKIEYKSKCILSNESLGLCPLWWIIISGMGASIYFWIRRRQYSLLK